MALGWVDARRVHVIPSFSYDWSPIATITQPIQHYASRLHVGLTGGLRPEHPFHPHCPARGGAERDGPLSPRGPRGRHVRRMCR